MAFYLSPSESIHFMVIEKDIHDIINGRFKTPKEFIEFMKAQPYSSENGSAILLFHICRYFIFKNDPNHFAVAVNIGIFDMVTESKIPILFYRATQNRLKNSLAFLCEKFPIYINQSTLPENNNLRLSTLPIFQALPERYPMTEYLKGIPEVLFLCADLLQLLVMYKGLSCIDVVDSKFQTPLWQAIRSINYSSIRLLVALGCTQHPRKRRKIPIKVKLANEEETIEIRHQCFFTMPLAKRLLVGLEELKVKRAEQTHRVITIN